MNEKTIKIPKISCSHCVMTIKRELEELDGVKLVEADADKKTLEIAWDGPINWKTIEETLYDIGYPPE